MNPSSGEERESESAATPAPGEVPWPGLLYVEAPTPEEWVLRPLVAVLLIALPAIGFLEGESMVAAVLNGALLLPLTVLETWFMRRSLHVRRFAFVAAWALATFGLALINAQSAFTGQILGGGSSAAGLESALGSLRFFLNPKVLISFLGLAALFASCSALRIRRIRGRWLFVFQLAPTLVVLLALSFGPGPRLDLSFFLYLAWIFGLALPLSGELGERWASVWREARVESAQRS